MSLKYCNEVKLEKAPRNKQQLEGECCGVGGKHSCWVSTTSVSNDVRNKCLQRRPRLLVIKPQPRGALHSVRRWTTPRWTTPKCGRAFREKTVHDGAFQEGTPSPLCVRFPCETTVGNIFDAFGQRSVKTFLSSLGELPHPLRFLIPKFFSVKAREWSPHWLHKGKKREDGHHKDGQRGDGRVVGGLGEQEWLRRVCLHVVQVLTFISCSPCNYLCLLALVWTFTLYKLLYESWHCLY